MNGTVFLGSFLSMIQKEAPMRFVIQNHPLLKHETIIATHTHAEVLNFCRSAKEAKSV